MLDTRRVRRKIHGAAVRELDARKASICDASKETGARRMRLKHHRPRERKLRELGQRARIGEVAVWASSGSGARAEPSQGSDRAGTRLWNRADNVP